MSASIAVKSPTVPSTMAVAKAMTSSPASAACSRKYTPMACGGVTPPISQRYRARRAASRARCLGPPPCSAESAIEARHRERRCRGFMTLIGRAVARPREGLFGRVRRKKTERDRHLRHLRRQHDAVRGGVGDVIEVRRLTANQAPEADHACPGAGRSDSSRSLRQLKGAGDREGHDIGPWDAGVLESGPGACLEPIGHKRVIAGNDQGETHQGPVREIRATTGP